MKEVLEAIVKNLVDNKDKVSISMNERKYYTDFKVRVHSDDIGNVIGRKGNVADSIKNILSSMTRTKVNLKIEEYKDRSSENEEFNEAKGE